MRAQKVGRGERGHWDKAGVETEQVKAQGITEEQERAQEDTRGRLPKQTRRKRDTSETLDKKRGRGLGNDAL